MVNGKEKKVTKVFRLKGKKKFKAEELCRKTFERIFDKKFPSCRPKFLKNPNTNYNLELDGYNPELQIAFEYSGKQHYEYPNIFHKTEKDFMSQVVRDTFKKKMCHLLKINLIIIPYTVKYTDIPLYIEKRLKRMGLYNPVYGI